MKIRRLGFYLVLFGFFSCTTETVQQPPEPQDPDEVILVGEDFTSVYTSIYNPQTGVFASRNLTAEIGVPLDYLIQRDYQNELSFYSFEGGAFSLFRTNPTNGISTSIAGFYVNSPERSIIWGADADEGIYLAFFAPVGSKNLSLLRMGLNTAITDEFTVEFGVEEVYPPLVANGFLLVGYQSGTGNYKIAVYQLENFQLQGTLDLGSGASPSYFVTENQQLGVLRSGLGVNPELEVYDLNSLEFLFSNTLEVNQFFQPGPVQAELIGSNFYYYFTYAQPSPVVDGPAQINLDDGINRLVDINALRLQLEDERGLRLVFTAKGVGQGSPPQYYLGYGYQTTDNSVEGGVLILDAGGSILAQRELPYIPTAIIARD